ncbi:hypothetical protein LV84_03250 [Algoriphagus ratkowskyi]|uniref:Uncharacterized protein n=1 Tax=Algoriphagus ratkowskyi TaxID=57028 RepID=A0A2W7R2U1_9BACT|nr:hypothetical protein [Algoriphagus ratkowskyi]PZX53526.1 hypothetical protein LV84_03250 [Algoriphagus ratkowskyi]TXD76448.1 hypothetical protein ESW18_15665 [Algoriphagus ratkowskyi]
MEERKIVLELIHNVLNGELNSLNELYLRWPETLIDNEFYESIYNDIESVVEHSIVKNKEKGIKEKLFLESIDYRNLIIDYKILNLEINITLLINLRNEFRKRSSLSLEGLDKELFQYCTSIN